MHLSGLFQDWSDLAGSTMDIAVEQITRGLQIEDYLATLWSVTHDNRWFSSSKLILFFTHFLGRFIFLELIRSPAHHWLLLMHKPVINEWRWLYPDPIIPATLPHLNCDKRILVTVHFIVQRRMLMDWRRSVTQDNSLCRVVCPLTLIRKQHIDTWWDATCLGRHIVSDWSGPRLRSSFMRVEIIGYHWLVMDLGLGCLLFELKLI